MTDTTTQSDWPIAFFDDDYLKIYAPRLTEEPAAPLESWRASKAYLPKR